MESYTRARTVEAVREANADVNRALEAGAMAVGARAVVEDYPGYMPLRTDDAMVEAFDANVEAELGTDALVGDRPHLSGSTDMGDVTQLVPGIHPWVGGFEGNVHSREFRVADEEMAYVVPAKLTAATVVDLLSDRETVERILAAKEAKKSREEYLAELRAMRADVVGDYLD
jgi:metal-dependent amidase/aminoacylase/carboxypeptidase family protein